MSITGMPETGPTRVGVAIGDMTSGMWTAMGVLAALTARDRTGRGQRVESSLLASLIGLLGVQGQRYLSTGEVPGPTGNVHPVIAPYGVFEAADGPLNLAPATQDMWTRLCALLGLESLTTDPRFITNEQRIGHRDALKILIDSKLSTRTRAEWTKEMIALGIPAGPINDLKDVFEDPQVLHCGLLEEIEHPILGRLKQVGSPITMDGTANGTVRLPPPMFGEHTVQVLREFGASQQEIDQLMSSAVVLQHSA